MDSVISAIGLCLLGALVIFAAVMLGTLFGALSGWIVGLFFEETILGILADFGIEGFTMWQIGAFLGFVGGFFRATVSSK